MVEKLGVLLPLPRSHSIILYWEEFSKVSDLLWTTQWLFPVWKGKDQKIAKSLPSSSSQCSQDPSAEG